MAAFSSKRSGDWTARRSWREDNVPGAGDTVKINPGHVITITTDTTIGLGAETGSTAAIALLDDGCVKLASGVRLQCKGDISFTARGQNNDYFVMDAGSTLIIEVPRGQSYRIGGLADFCYSRFRANGTVQSRCSIRAETGGGLAHFSYEPYSYGGSIIASYTDFALVGDSQTPAISIMYHAYNTGRVIYDMQYCTFDDCGVIFGYTFWGTDSTCRHKGCVHTNTRDSESAVTHSFKEPIGKGIREITYNVFDKRLGSYKGLSSSFQDTTIEQNYLADGLAVDAVSPAWALFQSNIAAGVLDLVTIFETKHNVFYENGHSDNPHFVNLNSQNGNYGVVENIFQTNTESESGDCILTGRANRDVTYTVKNNITLPAPGGGPAGSLVTFFGDDPLVKLIIDHNTHTSGGEGGVNLESGSWTRGHLLSYRNNIIWATPANTTGRFKLMMLKGTGTAVADVGLPANIDYNVGFNLSDSDNNPLFQNAHKGYCAPWSVTPGVHDLEVDPRFKDATRNIETFASAYLRKSASWVWNHATDYKVGDIVSRQIAGTYNNANILYCCKQAHHSSNSTAHPGDTSSSSDWRKTWEPASLFYIRQAIASGEKFTGLGITNGSAIDILIAWIRDGFTPTNPAIRRAGSDRLDIGAVQMSPKIARSALALPLALRIAASKEPASRRGFFRKAGLMLASLFR